MTKHSVTNIIATSSISLLALSALVLASPSSSADTSQTITLNLNVASVCTLSVNTLSHTATIDPGTSGLLGSSNVKVLCNDNDGLAVYAVGFSGDSLGNNTLISTTNSSNTIPSATASSPTTSQWNMTLAAVSGDYAPTITNQTTGDNPVGDFTQPHVIPTVYTKVAYRNSYTDTGTNATGASFTASFNAYVGATQTAGTYQGKVKFLLIHPNVVDSSTNPVTTAPDTLLTLQSVANWGSSVALGDTVEAMDERDGQMYKVKRLKMNAAGTETALWMSNLNLGAEPLKVDQLDNTNTNLPNDSTKFVSAATLDSWAKTSGTASNANPEFVRVPGQDTAGNKYGILYNFPAASAATYRYAGSPDVGDAVYDLCPSGWRMPTGGTSGEFKMLADAYDVYDTTNYQWNVDGLATMESILGFSRAGYFNYGTPLAPSEYGYYWSSKLDSYTLMRHLRYSSGELSSNATYQRYGGMSLRCISQ